MSDNEYWDAGGLIPFDFKNPKENNIDSSRIYLTGLSMGAWGAGIWLLHQETFAALVPVAGFVDRVPLIADCKTATVPIRGFSRVAGRCRERGLFHSDLQNWPVMLMSN
jgi:hypothetical protein